MGVAGAVHAAGGRIVLQLMHSGRVWHPDILDGQIPVAPSAVRPCGLVHTAAGKKAFVVPRELSVSEIRSVVSDFAASARRARVAGADAVEIHAANGYLLSQFLGYDSNQRTDAYGGSAQNRARFPSEVIREVAEAIGPDRLGLRISPGNPENDIHDHDLEAHLILAKPPASLNWHICMSESYPNNPSSPGCVADGRTDCC
jgi:N-ethylmaleimide reductase